jgi:tetratricopeptide (TPR) repeat protein
LTHFENAIAKNPSNDFFSHSIDLAEAYHFKGRVNQAKGDFARAIPDFTMAIKLDSADSDAKPEKVADHWNYCG